MEKTDYSAPVAITHPADRVAELRSFPRHTIRKFEALKWLRKTGAPVAALALLLHIGSVFHRMAIARLLEMNRWRMAGADAQVIGYVDSHRWVVPVFAAFFAACLACLQFRRSPRWSVRLTFAFLALPVLGYTWVCLRVVSTPFHY
jgi:hypothetical protein